MNAAPLDVVCECAPLPINYFRRDGEWSAGSVLTEPGDRAAARLLAGGFDAWAIVCPVCGLVYAGGVV
jgi:hypothetical protein